MIFNINTEMDIAIHAFADAESVVGVTTGTFDLLHPLHVLYLERCRAKCDTLIVGVDSDALYKQFKKVAPIQHESERVQMIDALKVVDTAFVMDSLENLRYLLMHLHIPTEEKKPRVLLFKHSPELYGEAIVGAEYASVVIVPDVKVTLSSTELKERIIAQAMEATPVTQLRTT